MNSTIRKTNKRLGIYQVYLLILSLLISLPIIAPIALALGIDQLAKVIYFIYSFSCHQFSTRSLYIVDHQYAWCARDTGIWIGWFVAAVLVYKQKFSNIKFYFLPLFVIPIALDGGIQTLFTFEALSKFGNNNLEITYVSNNLFRFLTGSFFGLGVGSWFSYQLFITSNGLGKAEISEKTKSKVIKYLFSYLFLILIYFSLIQVWYISSSTKKPTNIFDSKAKVNTSDFFERRADGICPSNEENLLNIDCFF